MLMCTCRPNEAIFGQTWHAHIVAHVECELTHHRASPLGLSSSHAVFNLQPWHSSLYLPKWVAPSSPSSLASFRLVQVSRSYSLFSSRYLRQPQSAGFLSRVQRLPISKNFTKNSIQQMFVDTKIVHINVSLSLFVRLKNNVWI